MTKLRRYQRKGVRKISHFGGRALLADEMGLGKTLQALWWAKKNKTARPIIVVCPASLKYVWELEASTHINMRAEVLESRKAPKRARQQLLPHQLIIINYDILRAWLPYLKSLKPQLVIIDECQKIQNPKAKRTRAVQSLCKGVPHVIGISGTPLTNRPIELWVILNILLPEVYDSRHEFGVRYCQAKMTTWGWQYRGAARIKELNRRLNQECMIRRLKKDVLKELPQKTYHVVPLAIDNKREYQTASKDIIGWLAKQNRRKANKAKRAERLVRMGYLKRLAAEGKYRNVVEWIDNFLQNSEDKLVLFGVHKKILGELHKRYKNISVLVTGDTPNKKRRLLVESFQKTKGVRLFIGNIEAAGSGLTLTAASTLAFVELGWTPGEHNQAADRIHRLTQRKACNIYYLIGRGTIEEDLCKLLQKKQEILSSTLDGGRNEDALDIYDQLEKVLLCQTKEHPRSTSAKSRKTSRTSSKRRALSADKP